MSKRQIKRAYEKAQMGLEEAVGLLMRDHDMMNGDAKQYLIRK